MNCIKPTTICRNPFGRNGFLFRSSSFINNIAIVFVHFSLRENVFTYAEKTYFQCRVILVGFHYICKCLIGGSIGVSSAIGELTNVFRKRLSVRKPFRIGNISFGVYQQEFISIVRIQFHQTLGKLMMHTAHQCENFGKILIIKVIYIVQIQLSRGCSAIG